MTFTPYTGLRGRRRECAVLDQLLAAARAGLGGVSVLRGDAGTGKSALLDYLRKRAFGCRVQTVCGVELEVELAFSGLHQLCLPILDLLEGVPDPQRDALATAFGLRSGAVPERLLVGLGVLSLFSAAAEERPLVCLVDDAQWLDRASLQALALAARRLQADSVALVFASRERSPELAGLPELTLGGLLDADAHALLRAAVPDLLDERVRARIIAETRGNPLALLELPRGLKPSQLAGGFGVPAAVPLDGWIEESFARRIKQLPADTQQLLLLAAAEPDGDPVTLFRACASLGIPVDAVAPARVTGLLRVAQHVTFRHPLIRSAIYGAASIDERRTAHRALAAATDPDLDPDRRAWHRSQATSARNELIASELERSAGRAQARGGLAAAAAFLGRAAALTPEPALRATRALAAAQAKQQAGVPNAALELLAMAEAGQLTEPQRARADLLRAHIAFSVNRGRDAPALLLRAASRFELLDPTLARETYLDAMAAATFVGRLHTGCGLSEVAEAARAAPLPSGPPRAADLLLDGLALLITEGHAAGAATIKRALTTFCSEQASADEEIRWLWLAGHAAMDVWDDESWKLLAAHHVQLARETGALAILPIALNTRIGVHLSAGEFEAAESLLDEVENVAEATQTRLAPYVRLAVAAFRGREADAAPLIDATLTDVVARGEGIGLTIAYWATAVLYNGLGRYNEALSAAQLAAESREELRFATRALSELVEAGVRSGNRESAANALEQLASSTQASGTDWALGTEARARALLSGGARAEALYREAIERLTRTAITTALARAHLVYGEWLSGERRRVDARKELRSAFEFFNEMGMEAFAQRAERGLFSTGDREPRRSVETKASLTAQEERIARLARDGLSNPEIGSRLFISARTVEYHLHKVYAKLGVNSRNDLYLALARTRSSPVAVAGCV